MQTSHASKIFCRNIKSKIIFLIDIDFEKKRDNDSGQFQISEHM